MIRRWLILFLIIQASVSAQDGEMKLPKSKSKLYKYALSAIDQKDYFLAKHIFASLVEKGLDNEAQKFDYAKMLYHVGEYKESFDTILSLEKNKFKNQLLYYYLSLLYNSQSKQKDAKDCALFFLKKGQNRMDFPKEYSHIQQMKLYYDSIHKYETGKQFYVYNVIGPVNKSGAEFSPIVFKNGILYGSQEMEGIQYFNSSKISKSEQSTTRKIYQAEGEKGSFSGSQLFPVEVTNMEVSSFSYSLDKRIIYLSGCRYKEELKKYQCEIYQSKFIDKIWIKPELIPELMFENASNTHVNIGYDELRKSPILFFASDRDGGRGGLDIYMSTYITRTLKFSTPRPLGGAINTPKDDITPHYHTPTNTLYFSSNGRGGKGGHDIYSSRLTNGVFEKVQTLAADVNSPQDDVFFYPNISVSNGYLVSNRYSKNSLLNPHCCDDIYYFDINKNQNLETSESDTTTKKLETNIKVVDEITDKDIHVYQYEIYRNDSNKRTLITSGKNDLNLKLSGLNDFGNYDVDLKSKGYHPKTENVNIQNGQYDKEVLKLRPDSEKKPSFAKEFIEIKNSKTNEPIKDASYKIYNLKNGTKSLVKEGKVSGKLDVSDLGNNGIYQIEIAKNGFTKRVETITISGNKLDKNEILISPETDKNRMYPKDAIEVKNKNTNDPVSDVEYKIYSLKNGIKTLVKVGIGSDKIDVSGLGNNGEYQIELTKNGFKSLVEKIKIVDNKIDKNVILLNPEGDSKRSANLNVSDCSSKLAIEEYNFILFRVEYDKRLEYERRAFIESGMNGEVPNFKELTVGAEYEIEMFALEYFRKKIRFKYTSNFKLELCLDPIDYQPIELPLVEFDFDSFSLTPLARHIIDSLLIPILKDNPTLRIELSAHTDNLGTDEYNNNLSNNRAAAIRKFLIESRDIPAARLESRGYGESAPRASNTKADGSDDPVGRQRNRRCEFRILKDFYDPY